MAGNYFIGIDVGTGSARAGIFDGTGNMAASAVFDIQMWKPEPDCVEQSSEDIWDSVCRAVKSAMADAGLKPEDIAGIGIDATCSLVAIDSNDKPVTVSPTGKDEQNIIVWMDHRAIPQAELINAMQHDVLRYVGGVISPEMQTPKLLWLKEHLPETWSRTAQFFDLPDWLTYRATGDATRSLCTTVCKWTYLGHEEARQAESVGRWEDSYWKQVGLGDLAEDGFERVGTRVRPMGEALGNGLTETAAQELGLNPGTAVGVSIIDAHAGGIGMFGAAIGDEALTPESMEERLALIGGTSSCHMAVSRDPAYVPGVWGPYYSAMVPGMWLTEGGQSATGALIDHVIHSHARAIDAQERAAAEGKTVYEILNDRLDALAQASAFPAQLTEDLHVLPYFHGNRSPRANPNLRGMVSGLRLADTLDDLARLYLATIQAVAYGTRHIVDEMNAQGYRIGTIFACGGGTKNPVFLREHADITGCRLVLSQEPETVLLGSAILGAVASGSYASILDAMSAMNRADRVIDPAVGPVKTYHDKKYAVFHRMHDDLMAYRQLMK